MQHVQIAHMCKMDATCACNACVLHNYMHSAYVLRIDIISCVKYVQVVFNTLFLVGCPCVSLLNHEVTVHEVCSYSDFKS